MVINSFEICDEKTGRPAGNCLAPNTTALLDLLQFLAFVVAALVAPCTLLPASAAEPAASFADARANRSPSMIFSSPTNGQIVPFFNVLYIHGTAFDSDGVVTQVMYFVNGQPIGTGSGQNWLLGWFATNLGPHVLTARATDNHARSAESAPIRIEVETFAPRLVLLDPDRLQDTVEPLEGAVLRRGSTNRFLAELEVYFPIQTIDLLVNGTKQNDPRTFPYLIWIPTNLGLHRLEAVIADGAGLRLTSAPVMVTIADVRPPSLTILSPAQKSSFAHGSTVTIRATASDSKGQITKMAIEDPGQTNWSNRGPTIEGVDSNLRSGWHRIEVVAVNDSAQTARRFLDFFVAYEENPALPIPEGFAGEADEPDRATLTWKVPTLKGAAVWLIVEQKEQSQNASEWMNIGNCPIEEGEFLIDELQAKTSYAFRIAYLDTNQRRSAYPPIVSLKMPPWSTVPAHFSVRRPR